MVPLFRHLYTNSKHGQEAEKLVKIALELVQARKESGQKVNLHCQWSPRTINNLTLTLYQIIL